MVRGRRPGDWPAAAIAAAVTTHDLPTVAGLWTGADVEEQRAAGTGTDAELERRPDSLLERLPACPARRAGRGGGGARVPTLAEAPSRLLSATLEDAVGEDRRPNMPGTMRPPNWSLPLPVPVEDLPGHPLVQTVGKATLAAGVATGLIGTEFIELRSSGVETAAMAGGMTPGRGGRSLGERAAASGVPVPEAPDHSPSYAAAGDGGEGRHCWVRDPPEATGIWPGLLVEWRQRGGSGRAGWPTRSRAARSGPGGVVAARRPARAALSGLAPDRVTDP